MSILRRVTSGIGALALAGSMGLGMVSQAQAAVAPVLDVTNDNFGAIFGTDIEYALSGCAAHVGGTMVIVQQNDSETGSTVSQAEAPAPATGDYIGSFHLPTAGLYLMLGDMRR